MRGGLGNWAYFPGLNSTSGFMSFHALQFIKKSSVVNQNVRGFLYITKNPYYYIALDEKHIIPVLHETI